MYNKQQFFKNFDIITKLIIVNVAVFLAISIINVFVFLFSGNLYSSWATDWFGVPSSLWGVITHPWTVFTYMFVHESFWHILGNMLWLFFLGRLFVMFAGEKRTLPVYVWGGLAGAFLFILAYNIFPVFTQPRMFAIAIGASASVTALVIATAVLKPDFEVYFFGLFPIKLKWIAIFFIIYDILSIPYGNAGGHIAHIGGAAYGFWFARSLIRGKDITIGMQKLFDKIAALFVRKPKMSVSYKNKTRKMSDWDYNKQKAKNQERMDKILEKISKYGYDSLSKEEKEFLFRMGNK